MTPHLCTFAQSIPPRLYLWKGSAMFLKYGSTLPYMLGSSDSVTTEFKPRFPHTDLLASSYCNTKNRKNLTLKQGHDVNEVQALTLDWLFDPCKGRSVSALLDVSPREAVNRILARLIQLEAHESQTHFKDDYRQAFITLSLAVKGNKQPFVCASYAMYGVHPDKLWKKMQDRKRAQLGIDFDLDQLEHDVALRAQSPQKSPSSVVTQKRRLA